MDARRKMMFRLVALGFGFALIVLALEVYFRVRAMQLEQAPFFGYYASPIEYDPVVGYRITPGFANEDFTITDAGYRANGTGEDEIEPGGVLCAGGSTTFGSSIPDSTTVSAQLEGMLRERSGQRIRVYNGGVPGMHAYHWTRRIGPEMKKLQPRFVVAWLGWNTFGTAVFHGKNWHPETLLPSGMAMPPQPRGAMGELGSALLARCRVLRELRNLQLRLRTAQTGYSESNLEENANTWARDTAVFAVPFTVQLDSVVAGIRAGGGTPILMTSPFLAPRPGEETALIALRSTFATETQYWNAYRTWWRAMTQVMRAKAAQDSLPLADLAAACEEWDAPTRAEYFIDMMHLSPAGCRAVAEQLAAVIAPRMKREE